MAEILSIVNIVNGQGREIVNKGLFGEGNGNRADISTIKKKGNKGDRIHK
jgi:hypothetical protein